MYWQFSNFYFNQEQQSLSKDDESVSLEPIAARLLSYFCQHPHKDISRDELLEQVWRGQIVSDNAVNRVIVQLRKALNDEAKPRQFIATVPKYGYRFVSNVKALSETEIEELNHRDDKSNTLAIRILAIASLVFAAMWLFNKYQNVSPELNANVSPMSRLTDWQYDADLSPDQRYLLYSVRNDDATITYLKDSDNESPIAVSPTEGSAHSARWSFDGSYFVYQYHYEDTCEFRRVNFSAGQIENFQVLQKCKVDADSVFALGSQDDILYFLERKNRFSPFEVFAFDMQEQQRWRLAQPVAVGLGNHYIDVHPETGKLLLISDQSPGKSSLFELDVINSAFRKLHDFDYDVFSAIWGHNQNAVVHPGEHPSYELMETNVETGESKQLLSDSRRISDPRKINNTKDYMFSSYLYNRDIEISDYEDSSFNSAVMDYLPKLSRDAKELTFISKREGYSQLFVKNLETGLLSRFEPKETEDNWSDYVGGRTYFSLDWSHDNKYILANTSRGFIIFDRQAMNIAKVIPITKTAYVSTWYDNQHISYSVYKDDFLQVNILNIDTLDTDTLDERWAFVLSANNNKLYFDQDRQLYKNAETPINEINCNVGIYRYQFGISLDGDNVYCEASDVRTDLLIWNAKDGTQRQTGVLAGAEFYSIANGRIAKTKVATATSDIMRTNY